MQHTQYVSIEFHAQCNLGNVHKACPNQHPERFAHVDTSRTLNDDMIVSLATRMYQDFGFRGLVAWHYYNEPLMARERMFYLMAAIRAKAPDARFTLWTNGQLLPHTLKRFDQFEQVYVTDYGELPEARMRKLERMVPQMQVCRWPLDDRISERTRYGVAPCRRMFVEFIVDVHGNVHLCCYDWRGLASPGNVFIDPLEVLVPRWQAIRKSISGEEMDADSPPACLRCPRRQRAVGWRSDQEIAASADKVIAGLCRRDVPQRQPGVVIVHYAIPQRRLTEHFKWNNRLYRLAGARVYVVTDRPYSVPDYARCVIVQPNELPILRGKTMFSLSLTKNRGIEAALKDSRDPIVVSDTDIAFSTAAWWAMVGATGRSAVVPVYLMARTYQERNATDSPDMGMTGTIGMEAARWRQVRFDERCMGYGAEDGQFAQSLLAAGICRDRKYHIWHIAHDPEKHLMRKPGHGSEDCWNRETLNPDNYGANRLVKSEK